MPIYVAVQDSLANFRLLFYDENDQNHGMFTTVDFILI